MTVLGIDVSVYQAATPSLKGLSFLFARASIGWNTDSRYGQHTANARAAGLVVGAYHFGTQARIATQVQTFLDAAGDVDLYALDVEGLQAPSHAQAAEFIKAMQKATGKPVGLYHSESGFFDAGQDFDWVANWSQVPARPWDFWQYRGSPLDLDRYNGTLDQLHELAGWTTNPPTTPEDPMAQAPITSEIPLLVSAKAGVMMYELDGKTEIQPVSIAITDEHSPWARGVFREVAIRTGGINRSVLLKPTSTKPVPPPPPANCTAEIAAALAPVIKARDDYHDRLIRINGLSSV